MSCVIHDKYVLSNFTGNYIELFSQKLKKNELILRDELKLLLHLCQSADDMVIARDAIYRYSTSLIHSFVPVKHVNEITPTSQSNNMYLQCGFDYQVSEL